MVLERKTPNEPRRWRRKQLAGYWSINERTVDRMARDGRLGEPKYIGKRTPIWTDEQRERAELSSAQQMELFGPRDGRHD
jgi:hypothetical protein